MREKKEINIQIGEQVRLAREQAKMQTNLASSFQSPMTANRITSLNVLLSRKKNDIISSKIAMIFSTRSSIWDNTLFMEGSLCGTIKRLL